MRKWHERFENYCFQSPYQYSDFAGRSTIFYTDDRAIRSPSCPRHYLGVAILFISNLSGSSCVLRADDILVAFLSGTTA